MGQLTSSHKHPGYVPGPVPNAPQQNQASSYQTNPNLPPVVAADEKHAAELDAADGNVDGTYFGAPIRTVPKTGKSGAPAPAAATNDPWHRDRYGYDFPLLEEVVELTDHGKALKPGQAPSVVSQDRAITGPSTPQRPPSAAGSYRSPVSGGRTGHHAKDHEGPSFLARHHHGDSRAVGEEYTHKHLPHHQQRSPASAPRYDSQSYERGYGSGYGGAGRASGKGGDYGYDAADASRRYDDRGYPSDYGYQQGTGGGRRYEDRAYPADYGYPQEYGRGQYTGGYERGYPAPAYGGDVVTYGRPRYEDQYEHGHQFDQGRTYDHDYYGGYGGHGLGY
jgi:hypothetical protein